MGNAVGELGDVRVVVAGEGIAASYCAKLFGDAGAEVVLVEPADGHPLRRWRCGRPVDAGATGALFRYLHHGHRSITERSIVDGGAALLASADVVVVERSGPLGDAAALAAAHTGAVVVAITPYGLDGPFAAEPWSELTLQAGCGSCGARGRPETPPLQMGGHLLEWVSGVYAAAGALAALRTARRCGLGELVDVSMLEVGNLSASLYADLSDAIRGRPDRAVLPPARSYETPSIEPTADGYVGFNTNTRLQFEAFCLMIERPELIDDPRNFASIVSRNVHWADWQEIVHGWTTRHTTAEIVELAASLRIPVAPVGDAPSMLALDHLVEREVYLDDPLGEFLVPRRPWRIDGRPIPVLRSAPEVGEADRGLPDHRTVAAPHPGPRTAPLDGIRVLDLTAWWAGPSATATLAAFGADVIHVESTGHPDGIRMSGAAFIDRPHWWELAGIFLGANTNKRDITLDLRDPRGRELLLRLVRECDLVVENFTPRVLEQLDLGWDVIHAANPAAVMVRMPAFGLTGSWRDRPGFAQTMEQLTGLAWVTGFEDDQPRIQRGPCDPNAGMHAVVATFAALEHRDRTGEGCLVEVPMVEAALAVAAESVIEWTAYGHRLGRIGNRSWRSVLQGLYRCSGRDEWLAVAVSDGVGLDALERCTGGRDDAALAEWAASQDAAAAAVLLRSAGIAAERVIDPRRASEHPQIVDRRFVEDVAHPTAGTLPIPGLPFRFASVDRWIRRHPPLIGEHNREVLGGLCGATDEDLAVLHADGVIGDRPKGF